MNQDLFRQTSCFIERKKIDHLHVGIFGKQFDTEVFQIILEMALIILKEKSTIYVDQDVLDFIKESKAEIDEQRIQLRTTSEIIDRISLIITIGGDGTILRALSFFQKEDPPEILSFQKGTLGFLCAFQEPEKFNEVLSEQLELFINSKPSNRQIKKRILGKLFDANKNITGEFNVLNEFVITRGNDLHLLKLKISILQDRDKYNEYPLTETSGGIKNLISYLDGLIISTPTGSTAYSLSAGGAVISDNVNSIQMIPICPLSLSFRPIVFSSTVKIQFEISPDSRGSAIIWADGQEQFAFKKDMKFVVSMSEKDAICIFFQKKQFKLLNSMKASKIGQKVQIDFQIGIIIIQTHQTNSVVNLNEQNNYQNK